jgi:hypothetical protein
VIDRLRRAGAAGPARRLLAPDRSPLGDLVMDLQALPHWRDRARLLREHLFPPPSFMARDAAPPAGPALLWRYARRLVTGGARWIRQAAFDWSGRP